MKRQVWLDTWRGLAVVHMVAYHILWDMVYLFGWHIPWFETEAAFYWEQWIAWSFIFISGFCAVRSRHLFWRGLEIFAMGIAITVVTLSVGGDAVIWFGILSLFGSAMVLTAAAGKCLRKCPPTPGLFAAACLFFASYTLPRGFFQLGFMELALPAHWYSGLLASFLGMKDPAFYSADYFPLFPWVFLFWAGYMAGRLVEQRRLHITLCEKEPLFSRIGRRALPVYLLHQPVAYGLLLLLSVWAPFSEM